MVLRDRESADEPVSQQVLGGVLCIDKSNVARLCARMERLGHVEQERPASDGRVRLLKLTTKGYRLAERIEAASRARFQQVLTAIPSASERDGVIAAVERLNQAIEAVGQKVQRDEA